MMGAPAAVTGAAHAAPSLDRSTKKRTSAPVRDLDQINAELFDLAQAEKLDRTEAAAALAAAWDGVVDEAPAGRWVRLSCENWRAIQRTKAGALYTPLNPEHAPRRAVLVTQTQSKPEPPRQSGDRWTEALSRKGQKAVEDAALYTHRMGRGFRTFCTLTLNSEARERLRGWDFMHPADNTSEAGPVDPRTRRSLGALAADFVRALKLGYRRGMVLRDPDTGKPCGRLRGHPGPLVFAWVAECPINSEGEPNPHIHLMMNWAVAPKNFRAWAAWIERIWPHGYANLTRLKKPKSAAAYMAKAAQYIAKGADGSQGAIRGNRYGIAKEARPPRARSLGTYYADWLNQAVAAMKDTARDTLKAAGLWAGKFAFGATSRAAWGRVWSALRADGWQFQPAPPDLHAVRLHNAERRARWQWGEPPAWAEYCLESWRDLLNRHEEKITWAS